MNIREHVTAKLEGLGGVFVARTRGDHDLWKVPEAAWESLDSTAFVGAKIEKVEGVASYNLKVEYGKLNIRIL